MYYFLNSGRFPFLTDIDNEEDFTSKTLHIVAISVIIPLYSFNVVLCHKLFGKLVAVALCGSDTIVIVVVMEAN